MGKGVVGREGGVMWEGERWREGVGEEGKGCAIGWRSGREESGRREGGGRE